MKKKVLKKEKRSVLILLGFSYITVLAFAVIVMAAIYMYMFNIAKEQTKRLNEVILNQATDRAEQIFSDFQNFNVVAMNNSNMQLLLNSDKDSVTMEYEMYQLSTALRAQASMYNSVDGWFVYFTNTDYIVSNWGVLKSEVFYNSFIDNDLPYTEWRDWLIANARDRYMPLKIKGIGDSASGCIAHIRGLPLIVAVEKSAVLVVFSSSTKFDPSNAYENIDRQKMRFEIVDAYNDKLFEAGDFEHNDNIGYKEFSGKTGMLDKSKNKQKYIALYTSSNISKLKYVMYITLSQYNSYLTHIRMYIFIGVLIIVIGETILTILFSRRIYGPIRDIVKTLNTSLGSEVIHKTNEYDYIKSNLKSIIDERSKILAIRDEIVRNNNVVALLEGSKQLGTETDMLFKTFGVDTADRNFLVILIRIENAEDLFCEIEDWDFKERYNTAVFILKNISEELFSTEHMCILVEYGETLACLLNLSSLDEAVKAVEARLFEMQQFIMKYFGLAVSFGVGEVHGEKLGIHKSYNEAALALSFADALGWQNVVFHKHVRELSGNDIVFSLDDETKFINFISVGDRENALSALWNILHENETQQQKKQVFFNLVISCAEELKINKSEIRPELTEFIRNERELAEIIPDTIEKLCAQVERDKQLQDIKHYKILVEAVQSYVEENYRDINLSLRTISDSFSINEKVLSRKFKELTGERLPDYINRHRINAAKDIIRARSVTIKTAAEMTGFASLRTFMRVFKSFEGITPGQFAHIIKNKSK